MPRIPSIPRIPLVGGLGLGGLLGDPLANGLIAWFDLDESTGLFVDRVNGLIASPLAAGGQPPVVSGVDGYAPYFTRTRGQSLVIPDSALHRIPTDLAGITGFTYASRASQHSFTVSSGLFSRANSGANNPELFLTTQTATQFRARLQTLATTATVDSAVGEPLALDTPFTVRVWADMAVPEFGIQLGTGAKVATSLTGKTFTPTNPTIQIGRYSTYWDGYIDWFAIWSRPLTDAEWSRLLIGGDV